MKEDQKETKGYSETNMDICRFHTVSEYLEGRREQSNTNVHVTVVGELTSAERTIYRA